MTCRNSDGDAIAQEYMSGPTIDPLELGGSEAVADLIDNVYGKSGFNGRRLAEAARLYAHMLRDDQTTVALTLAGAMTPIGMSGPIINLIESGFVDFIISTGANLYHDLHRPFNMPVVQGSHAVDDNELADSGIARIYDVFIEDDDTLMATDRVILNAMKGLKTESAVSTATFHKALGDRIAKVAPKPDKSLLAVAARYDVPVFTSSPGDSSIGMNLIASHIFGDPIRLDPILDVIESTAIVRAAARNGVVEVGGGSPKNFYMQTQPTLHQILLDPEKGGHDYMIQLTTDSPHWGGLSGATPSEARSWGKVKDAIKNNVVVYSCASLTFPLLAQYVLQRCRPRKRKQLLADLPRMTEELYAAARSNKTLREQMAKIYDIDP